MTTAPLRICVMVRLVGDYRLTVRLGRKARSGWQKAAHVSGCSITSIIEAIGQDLDNDPDRLLARGSDLIEAARLIDEDRRTRRYRPD